MTNRESLTIDKAEEVLAGKKVLLAEDDEVTQQQLAILLERLGAQVEILYSGSEVLRALKEGHYDLLILDLHLPPVNMLEFVRALRSSENIHLPVLGLSAADMSGRAVSAGVNYVLRKPFEMKEMKNVIQGLILSELN